MMQLIPFLSHNRYSITSSADQEFVFFPSSFFSDKKTVFISDLADNRLALRKPIPVVVEYSAGKVLAYSLDFSEFSYGDDEFEAIDEFKASVADLYFMLKDDSHKLGPLPMKHWNYLNSVIEES